MNREEFEDLLKDIPITNNVISSYSSINVEDIRKAIDRFKYVPSYRDLLEENNKMKERIDKAIDYINNNGILDLNGYDLLEILGGKE